MVFFSTISNIMRTIKNNDYYIGDKKERVAPNPFAFAIKTPKAIYVLKASVKTSLRIFGTTAYSCVAVIHVPQADKPWIVTIKENSEKLKKLINELSKICQIDLQTI